MEDAVQIVIVVQKLGSYIYPEFYSPFFPTCTNSQYVIFTNTFPG